PVTKSGLKQMSGNAKLTPYLDALPNAKLAPTTDPTWDKVKLDVQQNIGLAVQPGGDPKQVLDRLQRTAAGESTRCRIRHRRGRLTLRAGPAVGGTRCPGSPQVSC